jgi:GntR family transcriptional regulator, transcriptional repressor for pyruvate dehydrogenase complex
MTAAGQPPERSSTAGTRERVVAHLRSLIAGGGLRPGDRLPGERELARDMGVSRPSVRSGLRALAAMGAITSRRGAGTFVTAGPPTLGSEPLSLLAAIHGFTADEMFEARRILEVGVAGLAAEHASEEHKAALADEVTEMFAALEDPLGFLLHDVRFHRSIAAGCGNRVLSAIVEMVSTLVYEDRRATAERSRDLRGSAEQHRRIYRAIKARDPVAAREAMTEHLERARRAQAAEGRPGDAGSDPGAR